MQFINARLDIFIMQMSCVKVHFFWLFVEIIGS